MDTRVTGIKEANEHLIGIGQRDKAQVIRLPECEPSHRWAFWNSTEGALRIYDAEPGPIGFEADSLESLRDILLDIGTEKTRVFAHDGGVTAVLDVTGNRRDRVTLELKATGAWTALARIGGSGVSQDDLLTTLRTQLHDGDLSGLTALVRTMRFESHNTSEGALAAGAQSLSVDARRKALMGGKDIPDRVEFELSRYEQLATNEWRHTVKCALDVNIDRKLIYVMPLAGELDAIRRKTADAIADWLRKGLSGKDIKVWAGRP